MASGFIYLIILGMWAAYFLPKWMISHDLSSGKSAERYKSAMRVVGETGSSAIAPDSENFKKQNQIANRRIIFGALTFLLIAVGALCAVGIISASVLLIPTTALAIYVIHVRRQVVAAQLKARRIKAFEKISTASVITEPIERVTFSSKVDFVSENKEHWIPLIERIDTAGVVVIPKDGSTWQPTSIPKPTYATAPKAIPSNRIIDLTVPGAWIAAQQANAESELLPSRDELFDQELAENAANEKYGAVNE
ncbi:MAG: hypothetical protein F2853_01950 [Actinobacteria bacterium]|uniref:Unannotated protein n=1 Tax=freshwater metagenome TaxID=449393 RepID=A0A6J7K8U7_9ZZZZ|nr:hypothetical protein [Actinomycetota bacterium]MSZ02064.1 hypothetical protein [Actinomycetota bacterium]